MRFYKKHNRSKGVALIIILALIAAIVALGLSFIVRGDTELLCGQNMEQAADMDYLAESGLEHARGLILNPQDIATEYWTGATGQQLVAGSSDYYDVSITKISDCNWRITSTGYRQTGGSRTAQNSLTANLRLDPAIAFWSGADVSLSPAANITGDVYCNGILSTSGTINGDCFADSLVGNPLVTGSVKSKTALGLSSPAIDCNILKSNFSTQTIIPSSLTTTTLSGTPQVYYRNGSLEIRNNVIINGCLAVDGNLTVSGTGNVITAKKGVPAIYVSGNLIMKTNSALDCNGLVFTDGSIDMPIRNEALIVKGSLFTGEGIRHIVADGSGLGSDGIINGNCMWVGGRVNGAISFDGNGDFIDVGSMGVAIPNRITVAAWVKVNTFDKPYQAIVTKGDTSWRLQREGSTNKVQFACNTASGSVAIANMTNGASVNDGSWHHIAGVYDGVAYTITIYVDGEWAGGTGGTGGNIATNSFPVYIGENAEIRGRYFNGIIDEVRIYNQALTQPQIQAIAVETIGLVGYWSMDWGFWNMAISAAPVKAAIYDWPSGLKNRWSPAAGAFYKSITRNP